MESLRIDGAHGEGGGQIVRTAIALSCITKRPITVCNIRRNRRAPGLKAQHLTAVRILQSVCRARVDGAHLGSTELRFAPGDLGGRRLELRVGTAGSISLILQAVIPVMALSKTKSELKIVGGTDVAWSPTFDYMSCVVRDAFSRMGLGFSVSLKKRGYYPRGGGEAVLNTGNQKVLPASLTLRSTRLVKIRCTYSGIPEGKVLAAVEKIAAELPARYRTERPHVQEEPARDAGAAVLAYMDDKCSVMGADALYDKKTGSFDMRLDKITENTLGVDENLADMLVVPASIADGTSVFRVPAITKHLATNLFVASEISGCRYGVGKVTGGYEVRISGASHPGVHQ